MFETEMNTILCYKVASHLCSILISQLLLMLTYLDEAMMVMMIYKLLQSLYYLYAKEWKCKMSHLRALWPSHSERPSLNWLLVRMEQSDLKLEKKKKSGLKYYGWDEFCPPNLYVGVLTPRTTECDCIWTQVFKEGIKLKWAILVGPNPIWLMSL